MQILRFKKNLRSLNCVQGNNRHQAVIGYTLIISSENQNGNSAVSGRYLCLRDIAGMNGCKKRANGLDIDVKCGIIKKANMIVILKFV